MSRIRANQITNQSADGAPTVQHGLIIAGVSTFTGSVSIGGTLTYEDVTNIDSIGIITARDGLKVLGGGANIVGVTTSTNVSVASSVTATTYYGSGANLTGITGTTINNNANNRIITGSGTANTLEGEANLTFDGTNLDLGADDKKLRFGGSNQLELFYGSSLANVKCTSGNLNLISSGAVVTKVNTSEDAIVCNANSSVDLYHNNTKAFSTTQYGVQVESFGSDSSRMQFATSGHTYSQIGYFGLNRFGIDTHDGLEVRDASASYATRMKIDENGRFNVNAGGSLGLQTNHHCIQNSNSTSWAMQAVNTASLGYGVEIRVNAATASREALYIYSTSDSQSKAAILSNGTFNSRTNTYGSLSDVKLKENIVDANSQWDDLKAIKVRNFNFISDSSNTKLLGVVAQELETVCPSLIENISDKEINGEGERVETGTSTKNVKYSILYMKAIKTLQEAQTRIEVLETRLNNAGIAT
jgi:hypothetical protein